MKNKTIGGMKSVFCLCGLFAFAVPAQAASFDCKKVSTKVENLVCDTPVISMLDDYLQHVYLEDISKANDEEKQNLMNEQKLWLQDTRNKCSDKSCLKQAYLTRIKALEIISKKKLTVFVKKADQAESNKQDTQMAAHLPSAIPASWEEIQHLLNVAHKELKEKQKGAHDVLFLSAGMPKDKTGYCEKFWNTIKAQDTSDIPKPDMFAVTKADKEKMLNILYAYAKDNFDRYTSQDGKLTPDRYTDEEGRTRPLVPFIKGKINNPEYLAQKFKQTWQSKSDEQGFLENDYPLNDSQLAAYILYMRPYPVPGYVRPLVITFVKDQCDNCTTFSMGVRVVSMTGLPQPDLLTGYYFSQASYADAVANTNKIHTILPQSPYLIMGVSMINGHLTFWTLKDQIWVNPSAKEIDEDIGYENGDGFRDYLLNVIPLDSPGYSGPGSVCSVKFN